MKTYRTVTLGCKVNQYETRELEELLERAGLVAAPEGAAADLALVNTCVVTGEAARQCRQAIRRLRRECPAARLIVTGCYAAEGQRDELAGIKGISLLVADKAELRRRLARELSSPPEAAADGISRFAGHTRAFVKIQDGCDQPCAYCIVPRVRPRLASRPEDQVVEEVRRLCAAGHREIVLSGIHLGRYGAEAGRAGALERLVQRLVALPELGRARLSSIEAGEVSDGLLDLMAAPGARLCPHLHLPLQSGDDEVLRAMRRPYTAEEFLGRVEQARRRVPGLAVTSDVIVGFPGESPAAFERTCDAVRRAGLSRLHVFPFSPRRGTPAADMAGQVPAAEKHARADSLRRLGHELAAQFAADLVGRDVTVLIEQVAAQPSSPDSADAPRGNAPVGHQVLFRGCHWLLAASACPRLTGCKQPVAPLGTCKVSIDGRHGTHENEVDGLLAEGFDGHYVRTQIVAPTGANLSRGHLVKVRAVSSDAGTLLAEPV